ncbi:MAG: DUF2231 domain-containing protein [Ilyomonas sp.]
MKLFDHPVHPLLIHFPTALLPMDLVMNILYSVTGNASFYETGFYSLVGGVGVGLLAVLTGLLELFIIPGTDKKAMALALYHGFLNGAIIAIFAIITYKAWQTFPSPYSVDKKGIIIKSMLIIFLFIGNYMGGRLIYKHHIGIGENQTGNIKKIKQKSHV